MGGRAVTLVRGFSLPGNRGVVAVCVCVLA